MKLKLVMGCLAIAFAGVKNNAVAQDCEVFVAELKGEYVGECKKGKAHGEGKAEGIDIYEGNFVKGLPSGKGTYTWSSGKVFVGGFRKGRMEGRGELSFYANGKDTTQVGYWKEGYYMGVNNLPSYSVMSKRNVDNIRMRKVGDGARVTIKFTKMGSKTSVSNITVQTNNGSYIVRGGEVYLENSTFPIEAVIQYKVPNKLNTVTLDVKVDFAINVPGQWEVVMSH